MMKHQRGTGRFARQFGCQPDDIFEHRRLRHPPHDHGHGPRRRGRLFDYGELRLLVLALIADKPAHGYELIKAIEERFGGSYTPSPGVIYPTLAWLEDSGFATVAPDAGRKNYVITPEGSAFLHANRAEADGLLARGTAPGEGGRGRHGPPSEVLRAMENLKTALRLKRRDGISDDTIERIAALIDQAALDIGKA